MGIPVEVNFTGSGTLTAYGVKHCTASLSPPGLSDASWALITEKVSVNIKPGTDSLEKGDGSGEIETISFSSSHFWFVYAKFQETGDNLYSTFTNDIQIQADVSENCEKVVININGNPSGFTGAGGVTVDGGDKQGIGILSRYNGVLNLFSEASVAAASAGLNWVFKKII
ncbi:MULTISPECIES: hypothetical protein [unclassified Azospirillum]|uniref:hypothetical protein n=1 Tax=unclassified Azospirillum TaxID=2630922 RepID=UPI0011777DDF|nr:MULTISPECIES: hypothetical protein [unclassified Azospirillum]